MTTRDYLAGCAALAAVGGVPYAVARVWLAPEPAAGLVVGWLFLLGLLATRPEPRGEPVTPAPEPVSPPEAVPGWGLDEESVERDVWRAVHGDGEDVGA